MSKKIKKVRAGVLAFLLAAAALFVTGFSALAEPERAGSFSSYRTADAYRALQVGESYGLAYEEGQTLYALAAERNNALLDSWREGVLQTVEGVPIFCIESDASFSTTPSPTVYEGLDYLSQDLITRIAVGLKWMEHQMDQLSNNQTDLYFFQQCLVWSLQDAAGYQTYGEPAVYVPPYTASHNGDLSFACAFVRQAMNYAEENAGRFKGYAKVLDNRYTQQCAVFLAEELPSEGSLEIRKASALPELTEGNAGYCLEGAEFTLYEAGTDIEAAKLVTDDRGYARVEGIEEGSYEIRETRAPSGYLLDSRRYPVTITADAVYTFECLDQPGRDPLELLLIKRDSETGGPQAGTTLEGAEYTVRYYDGEYAGDPKEPGREPKYTWIFRTDAEGKIYFSEDWKIGGDPLLLDKETGKAVVPVGTLTIQETKAPEGYVLDDTVYTAETTVENGVSAVTEGLPNQETRAAKEQIIRGDLSFVKADGDSREPMGGIPFTLTFLDTGESHRIFTDENGYYSTSSSHVPHTQNTNAGTSPEDGVWFGEGEPDDSRGALLYGTYLLEEEPCEKNQGKELIAMEFTVSEEGEQINLGTVNNYTVALRTRARDGETGTSTTAARKNASIIDTVTYENLTAGETYTLQGQVMVKETGEILLDQGKPVEAELEFTPEASAGTVEMTFTFDASDLAGQNLVVFETLSREGREIASHKDFDAAEQTVSVPEARTSALDRATGSHVGTVCSQGIIADTLEYRGLTPGAEYRVLGTLMDQETGEVLLDHGEPVKAETILVPEKREGSVELIFRFDASGLAGKTVTAFETIFYEDLTVAFHGDLNDEEQSVHYPAVRTEAFADGSHETEARGLVKIRDEVSYDNLIPGETYELQGVLMDQASGKALEIDGREVRAEKTFTPEESSGTVFMDFSFRADGLGGKTLVVCEDLCYGGKTAAAHRDLRDEAQAVFLSAPPVKPETPGTGDHSGTAAAAALLAAAGTGAVLLRAQRRKAGQGR